MIVASRTHPTKCKPPTQGTGRRRLHFSNVPTKEHSSYVEIYLFGQAFNPA